MIEFDQRVKSKLASMMPSHKDIEWSIFESIFTKKQLLKKENWVNEYEESDKVCIVESGLMRIFMYNQKGEEKTHSFIIEGGAALNHFWIYAREPSPVTIQALEDTTLYETSHTKITQMFGKHPCWDELYRNLLIETFMFKLKREMFFVMYDASERLENLQEFPYVDPDRIPKTHLASFLGIKPQSFSRITKKNN